MTPGCPTDPNQVAKDESKKPASVGGLFRRRGQSAIRTRTASKAKPGACLAAPLHDAVVGVDLPVTIKSADFALYSANRPTIQQIAHGLI